MEVPESFRRQLHDYALSHGKPDMNGNAGLICLWNRIKSRFAVLEYNPLKRAYEPCFWIESPDTHQARPIEGGMTWVFSTLDARDTRKRFASVEEFIDHYVDQDERNRQSETLKADEKWAEESRADLEKEVHFIHDHSLTDGSTAELLTPSGAKQDHAIMPASTPDFAPKPQPEAAHVQDTHAT